MAHRRVVRAGPSARQHVASHDRPQPRHRRDQATRRPPGGPARGRLVRRRGLAAFAAALAELPDAQREALALAYFDGLSHSEIAERLRVPVGTVKGRIRLALDRLCAIAPKYALQAEAEA